MPCSAIPGCQRHRKQSEEEDTGIVLKLLRMLPEAFLYQYAGSGAGASGKVEKFASGLIRSSARLTWRPRH